MGDFSVPSRCSETQPAAPRPQLGFTFCKVQNDVMQLKKKLSFTAQRALPLSFLKCSPTNSLTSIPLSTISWV